MSYKKLKKIWIYRFEHMDPNKGLWYNKFGEFVCKYYDLNRINMPYEPDVYKNTFKSGCVDEKGLSYWVSYETAVKLLEEGYRCVRYLSDDYFTRDHGEYCFNKNTIHNIEVVSLDKIYPGKTQFAQNFHTL